MLSSFRFTSGTIPADFPAGMSSPFSLPPFLVSGALWFPFTLYPVPAFVYFPLLAYNLYLLMASLSYPFLLIPEKRGRRESEGVRGAGVGRFGEWEEGDRCLDVLLRPSQESHGPLTVPEMHTRTSKSGQMHNSEWAGPNNCSGLWAAEVVPSCQAAPWEDQDRGILLLGMCRSDRGGMALDWLVCPSETSPGCVPSYT